MSQTDLLDAFGRLGHPRALVIGDLILDRYCWGNAERISQEAPVIVLRADARESRLGGAANVCQLLAGLEAQVTCAGVVGDDADGAELRRLLSGGQTDDSLVLVDDRRPTTMKERFVGRADGRHAHQILRVDRETCDELPEQLEREMARRIVERLGEFDVVLVSDYAKGVCTGWLLQTVTAAARRAGIPVVVDPRRGVDYTRYRGVTTVTPNRHEAELATGRQITTAGEAFAAGRQLCESLDLEMAVVTLDRDGMALVRPDGRGELFPTTVKKVYDITGAGDMVLATIGVCLAEKLPAEVAVRLGNVCAGLEVEQVGVAVVSKVEIRDRLTGMAGSKNKLASLPELAAQTAACRRAGQRVVFTNGCFDLLHVGHVHYLEQAAGLGDVLVVALNSDASVRRLKGATRPVIGQLERAAMLAALEAVDHVILFDEDTPHALLRELRPDVLVKGGTYRPEEVVGREIVESYGGKVAVTGCVDGISTTQILASVQRDELRAGNAKAA